MFGQNVTEHNPAPSPSGHPLLSGPPNLNERLTVGTCFPPSDTSTMGRRSTIVLVALCLSLTVRADEYGEADGDANSVTDATGALWLCRTPPASTNLLSAEPPFVCASCYSDGAERGGSVPPHADTDASAC